MGSGYRGDGSGAPHLSLGGGRDHFLRTEITLEKQLGHGRGDRNEDLFFDISALRCLFDVHTEMSRRELRGRFELRGQRYNSGSCQHTAGIWPQNGLSLPRGETGEEKF